MKFDKLKIIIKMARPKKEATDKGVNTAKQEVKKEVPKDQDLNTEGFGKIEVAPIEENAPEPTAKEIKLQAEVDRLKAGKVVEVKTEAPKEVKVSAPRVRNQAHTVYVTKKKGDDWGEEQTREMSEQAFNAISKDLSVKVRLPRDSRLVEPEAKGCKDC